MEFETQVSRKDKKARKEDSDSSSFEEEELQIPMYLGISLHEDKKMTAKMKEMLPPHLDLLLE